MTKLMKLTCKKGRVHTILYTESALEKTGYWWQPSTRRRRRTPGTVSTKWFQEQDDDHK